MLTTHKNHYFPLKWCTYEGIWRIWSTSNSQLKLRFWWNTLYDIFIETDQLWTVVHLHADFCGGNDIYKSYIRVADAHFNEYFNAFSFNCNVKYIMAYSWFPVCILSYLRIFVGKRLSKKQTNALKTTFVILLVLLFFYSQSVLLISLFQWTKYSPRVRRFISEILRAL